MYTQDFYIEGNTGNNAFSLSERKNKKLFVPKLKKIESFEEIKLLTQSEKKITFEEYDFNGKMQTCFGLENLYELQYSSFPIDTSPSIPLQPLEEGKKTPLYLVDNHNHVFYFWYLARSQGIISDNALLYHIDEHADMRDPGEYLIKPESQDLQKVFQYTNFFLNVGNYIIPAQKEGLIGKVVQIRGESTLREYLITHPQSFSLQEKEVIQQQSSSLVKRGDSEVSFESQEGFKTQSIILNLDLDFFEPELDFIDYDLKKQVILDIARKADLITVCTSPYFIDQQRALKVFRDLFQ